MHIFEHLPQLIGISYNQYNHGLSSFFNFIYDLCVCVCGVWGGWGGGGGGGDNLGCLMPGMSG